MTGPELKKELKNKDVNLTELARKLGMSQQNLNNKLSVKSIKYDLLQQIENALGYKIEIAKEEESKNTGNEDYITLLKEQISILKEQNLYLRQKLDEKDAIIKDKDIMIEKLNSKLQCVTVEYQEVLNSDTYKKKMKAPDINVG